ncbi:MAG: homocysteine S-methyltransferase family protein [Myxococcota bacterium]|nr:homocysteine S-methyltransferase family protein [Myxococcota bacterium]
MSSEILLLDGATGTELQARGASVPNHITSIWSAQVLLDDPEKVVEVHDAYIDAGADVITVNNYAVTRPLLARESLDGRFAELTDCALDLAERSRDKAARAVQIAGSLPPLETSYRPGLVLDDATLLRDYEEMVERLAPRVDILLCETMSCVREAKAAVQAACGAGVPVWLSWTLQGDRPDQLPSGESLPEAYEAVAEFDLEATLVNCCGANFVTRAIPILASVSARRIGGYANAAHVLEAEEGAPIPEPEDVGKRELDVSDYSSEAQAWIRDGATIVGGCCSTRPSHIRALREMIDGL